MCGFAGIWQAKSAFEFRTEVLESLKHRGPDGQGEKDLGISWVGHTRLAIIDPDERSAQPMSDPTGRYTMVYNGEVYNFKSIRNELEVEGVEFSTESDTEVVLQSLIRWGKSALQKFNGCFALAFIDAEKEELLLARDRFGINPLFYLDQDEGLVFSSEFRSLELLNDIFEVSKAALGSLFQYSFIHGEHTLDQRVRKLLPGQYVQWKNGEATLEKWYSPNSITGNNVSPKRVLEKLEEAVVRRLVADVPVATFLSGGVDSSAVSALAARNHKGIQAFSVGFENEYLDELEWAKKMAKEIDCLHHFQVLRESDMLESFDDFIQSLDEPFADSSALAVFMLSRFASQHVKVCLSGDGADEVFGGYNRYRAFWTTANQSWKVGAASLFGAQSASREGKWSDLQRKLAKLGGLKGLSGAEVHNTLSSFSNPHWIESATGYTCGPRAEYINTENILQLDQQFILPADMLTKIDVMSMANGLEVRTPFLDHELVELVNSLPSSAKFNGKQGKIILKQALKGIVPEEILYRRKSGFEIPVESWLKGTLGNRLEAAVLKMPEELGINKKALYSAFEDFQKGNSSYATAMWAALILREWWLANGPLVKNS